MSGIWRSRKTRSGCRDCDLLEGLAAVFGFADYLDLGKLFQFFAEDAAGDGFVVHDESFHGVKQFAGESACATSMINRLHAKWGRHSACQLMDWFGQRDCELHLRSFGTGVDQDIGVGAEAKLQPALDVG